MSPADLVDLVCCDLGGIVRGRAVLASELQEQLTAGIGWVPANHALTPLGPLAEPSPFGSTGDLRLLADPDTQVRVGGEPDASVLELMLCDIVQTDGTPWECCPRHFLREALAELHAETGARVLASFEHEFQLTLPTPAALPFSLHARRRCEPFATACMDALVEAGVEPERFFAEFADDQFEIPVAATEGIGSADRAVLLREIVREIARRGGARASFTPMLDPTQAGNGVHIHISLLHEDGRALLYDPARPASLSELGGSFAAGVLRHAAALCALCAPSPVSAERLRPHHWSAGAVCLGQRNREALLRIPPLVEIARAQPERQLRLEFRGADAAANPHLALGAILGAGLAGIRDGLPTPPILDRDPAELDGEDAERFGVGALPGTLAQALDALEGDMLVRGGMGELLYDAYTSIKRTELELCAELSLEERCRRYGEVY